MRRKTVIFLFAFLACIFSTVSISVHAENSYYDTQSVATTSTIEVSENILNKANSNSKKHTDNFSHTAYLSMSYNLHIYHFEAPKGGYYNFYTTGNTDTIIKVYEQENFLWWVTGYNDLGLFDDGCRVDSISNATAVLDLEQYEDYFICVRAWNKGYGTYTLNVEPNEDKINIRYSYGRYSHWDRTGTSWNSALAQSMGAPTTKAKTYLTKEEVALFYWALTSDYEITDPRTGKKYSVESLYREYNESVTDAISDINTLIGLICSIPKVPSYIGMTATIVGLIFDYGYKADTSTKEEMKQILKSKCGADKLNQDAQFIDGELRIVDIITAEHGLCIEDIYMSSTDYESGFTWNFESNNYSAYDFDERVGVEYEAGSWIK